MKKQATTIVAILLVLALIACFAGFVSAQSFKFGDANCDGKLNIKDATTIQRHAAMIIKLDETALKLADVNSDGKVNVKDATMIQKYLAKLIASFPADTIPTEPTGSGDEATADSVPTTDVENGCVTSAPTEVSTGHCSDPEEVTVNTTASPSDTHKPTKPVKPTTPAKPAESKPAPTDPEEIVTDPTEVEPQETKPATKPAETKPATKPAVTKPAETKPATKPAETKPAETKPAPTPPSRDDDGYFNEVVRP